MVDIYIVNDNEEVRSILYAHFVRCTEKGRDFPGMGVSSFWLVSIQWREYTGFSLPASGILQWSWPQRNQRNPG